MAVRDGLGMCSPPLPGPPSLVGMLLVLQASHVATTRIACMCCVLDAWNMHICFFFHVSVSQHEAKLGQHHQHGQVSENTEAQI